MFSDFVDRDFSLLTYSGSLRVSTGLSAYNEILFLAQKKSFFNLITKPKFKSAPMR
jgi:hypothetical protein